MCGKPLPLARLGPVSAVALAVGLLATQAHSQSEALATTTQPVEVVLSKSEARYSRLQAEVAALTSPAALLARNANRDASKPVITPPDVADAEIDLIDLRLVLAEMARTAGANDQLAVIKAQPAGRLQALSLRAGEMDLATLLINADKLGFLGPHGLQVPLVIQPDARLVIAEGTLRLDRARGAFIANFGRLEANGAAILASGDQNPGTAAFAPFITTTSTGSLVMENVLLEGLGFGRAPAFSGLAMLHGGLYGPDRPSALRGVLLRDLVSVQFDRAESPLIENAIFVDSRGNALELRDTDHARISGSLFLNSAGDAIRLTRGSLRTHISNSEIYATGLNGVRLNVASHDTAITDLTVWRAGKAALSADRSDCLSVTGLSALFARQKGVSLRLTRASRIENSAILGAGSAGLFVAEQPEGAVLKLTGNRIAGNRIGLSTAAPAALHLEGNDFTAQFPRFIKGDLAADLPALTADLSGKAPMTLVAGSVGAAFLPPLTCSLATES